MLFGIDYEPTSLALTRLTSTVVSVMALVLVIAIIRRQPARPKRIVPCPVLWFTAFWLTVLTFITSGLLIMGNDAVAAGAERVIYGMSFIWSIAGLSWILYYGQDSIWKSRRILEIQEQIEKHRDGEQ